MRSLAKFQVSSGCRLFLVELLVRGCVMWPVAASDTVTQEIAGLHALFFGRSF